MTTKTNNSDLDAPSKDFYRLSIQISLNGLSFCILDTVQNTVISSDRVTFHKELTPYQTLKELQKLLEKHNIPKERFNEVIVIHRNKLFSLVPKSLFHVDELANYLKFNARILANDHIAYDELEEHELVNVYVPFVNINNYVYELFGAFTYKHHGTVLLQSLLTENLGVKEPIVYVHVFEKEIDVTVVSNKRLLFFNNFEYDTREDFLYYLLFSLEQLQLDTETVDLKLLGAIEEGDALYQLCYEYVKRVTVFYPSSNYEIPLAEEELETIDFTVLNAL